MKNGTLKRITSLCLAYILASGMIVGCGSDDTENKTNSDASQDGVETIIVGTSTNYMPYCYLDSNTNEFTGYDIEVLKAADELLPQYEFEYKGYDTTERLLALESNRIDIAAGQFERNEEREERYLFSTVGYTDASSQIVVSGDNTTINGIEDCSGKKVYVIANSNASYQVEKYNTENNANIELVYGENNFEVINQMMNNGSIDAYVSTARTVELNNDAYGTDYKCVGDPIMESETYYLFNKSNTELQTAIDGALEQLKENGEMTEICVEWLGKDYVPKD